MKAHQPTPPDVQDEPATAGSLLEHVLNGGSLRELLPLRAIDDEPLYAFGYELYTQARYEQALPIFALLVARDAFERRFLRAYASCLQMQGHHAMAIPHYLTVAALDPTDPIPIFHACECLIATGRIAQAQEGLQALQAICLPVQHDHILKKAQGLVALIQMNSQPPRERN